MITEFKIFENKEQELLEMGYGIYLYNNIFFKKGTKQYSQYDIRTFVDIKETLTVNYVFSRMLGRERTIKNWWYYFTRDHNDIFTYTLIDKLIDILLKKKLIEQFCVIKHILLNMYEDTPNNVKITKRNDSITNLLREPKIESIVEVVLDYYDENEINGFNQDLGYKELGKSIEKVKESINDFYVEQEMTKYNM